MTQKAELGRLLKRYNDADSIVEEENLLDRILPLAYVLLKRGTYRAPIGIGALSRKKEMLCDIYPGLYEHQFLEFIDYDTNTDAGKSH